MAQHDGMVQRGLRLSLDALGVARRRLNGFRDKRRDTYRGNAADATIYLNKAHDVSSVQGERRGGERIEGQRDERTAVAGAQTLELSKSASTDSRLNKREGRRKRTAIKDSPEAGFLLRDGGRRQL
ncbi:hypothetical protein G5I_06413 [Acromyrmex echinatior]|uniref:Uncharacterized protein n=1 Tax=Acromyrmex echinatior TaxID=103372 RepID=F4WKZ2_ACREC|nr:hypothetical protein G5I_06413 [Acromyrmex echinatior]